MAAPSDIDQLFQLPLGQFTAARNALAGRLKKAGRAEDADRVRTLAKPPISAWAVNQLYWGHRKAFDQLIAAGERFRKAQASQLAGKSADMRGPLEARRVALTELTKIAASVLTSAGHNPSPDTMRRITTTLEALATYGSHQVAPPAGRLSDDVEPPGFEALAALVPQGGGAKAKGANGEVRVLPFRRESKAPATGKKKKATPEELEAEREQERKRQLAAAKDAVREAERALKEARKEAEQAEAALKKAAARAKEAEQAKAELDAKLEKASAEASDARLEARRVATAAEDAAQNVDEAERTLEKARRELEGLS